MSQKRRVDIVVSSTYRELQQHRAAVIAAISERQMIPLAQEFDIPLGQSDLIQASLELVAQADIYIGLIGTRYGQTPKCPIRNPSNLSLTELEYNLATQRNLPRLIFIMSEQHPLTMRDLMLAEEGDENREKYRKFIDRLHADRIVAPFDSIPDLKAKVTGSLVRLLLAEADLFDEPGSGPVSHAAVAQPNSRNVARREFQEIGKELDDIGNTAKGAEVVHITQPATQSSALLQAKNKKLEDEKKQKEALEDKQAIENRQKENEENKRLRDEERRRKALERRKSIQAFLDETFVGRLISGQTLTYIAIVSAAINLFSAIAPAIAMAKWIRSLTLTWLDFNVQFWTWLASFFYIRLPDWFPVFGSSYLSFITLGLLMNINSQVRAREILLNYYAAARFTIDRSHGAVAAQDVPGIGDHDAMEAFKSKLDKGASHSGVSRIGLSSMVLHQEEFAMFSSTHFVSNRLHHPPRFAELLVESHPHIVRVVAIGFMTVIQLLGAMRHWQPNVFEAALWLVCGGALLYKSGFVGEKLSGARIGYLVRLVQILFALLVILVLNAFSIWGERLLLPQPG